MEEREFATCDVCGVERLTVRSCLRLGARIHQHGVGVEGGPSRVAPITNRLRVLPVEVWIKLPDPKTHLHATHTSNNALVLRFLPLGGTLRESRDQNPRGRARPPFFRRRGSTLRRGIKDAGSHIWAVHRLTCATAHTLWDTSDALQCCTLLGQLSFLHLGERTIVAGSGRVALSEYALASFVRPRCWGPGRLLRW